MKGKLLKFRLQLARKVIKFIRGFKGNILNRFKEVFIGTLGGVSFGDEPGKFVFEDADEI